MKSLRLSGGEVRLLLAVVALAVLAIGISLLFSSDDQEGSIWRQPSTFFTADYGTKAMFVSMDRMGYRVERVRRSLTEDRLWGLDGLVIAEPQQAVASHEIESLRQWLREGGTLVIAAGEIETGIMWLFSPEDDDMTLRETPGWTMPAEPVGDQGDADDAAEAVRDVMQAHDQDADDRAESIEQSANSHLPNRTVRIATGDVLLSGVAQLDFGDQGDRLDHLLYQAKDRMFTDTQVLYADEYGPAVVRLDAGRGQVIVLANSYPLSNAGIDEADNTAFIANLAMALGGGVAPEAIDDQPADPDQPLEVGDIWGGYRVGFDEYHLGFAERDNRTTAIVKLIVTGSYGLAVSQVIVVLLIALLAAGVKFGRPRDIPPIRRRNRSAFARAAGGLMRAAGAGTLTLGTLVDYHRQHWCRTLGLPVHTEDAALDRAIQKRTGLSVSQIFDQINRSRTSGKVSDQRLLDLARQMHRVSEVLDHGA